MMQNARVDWLFRPGNGLLLEYVDEHGFFKSYGTRVEKLEGKEIMLLMPVEKGKPARIPGGTEMTLLRQEEREQQAFIAYVKVLDIGFEGVPVIICTKPGEIIPTSRRRFFRCEVDLPFSYQGKDIEGRGRVINLSLSGLYGLVKPGKKIKVGMPLTVKISMPGVPVPFSLQGQVVRLRELKKAKKLGIAIDFRNISTVIQDEINRYIFKKQREFIDKGVLFRQPEDFKR